MKSRFIKIAVETAVKAGIYAKRRKGKIKKISYKGDINLVTDVDKSCEKMIVSSLRKHFRGHSILSEEDTRKPDETEFRWVVDPLDGTTNYSKGLPIYSVSIALERKGKTVLGVVYDPERDELFRAERGKGSFLNKKRIYVSKSKRLIESLLVTGFAYDIRTTKLDNMEYFRTFIKKSLAVRRLGSAAIDLCYVACGRFDGFWEMNLHPWDSAAGYLIVMEAGGSVTKFDGSCYSHYDRELLATNSIIHKEMLSVLRKENIN